MAHIEAMPARGGWVPIYDGIHLIAVVKDQLCADIIVADLRNRQLLNRPIYSTGKPE